MKGKLLSFLYLLVALANLGSWIFFEGSFDHFTKPLLMPLLMLFLYENFKGLVVKETLILFGTLLFSWLGDLALMESDRFFLPGVGSFLIAQLLYIRLFYSYKNPLGKWINWKSGLLIVYGVLLLSQLLPTSGDLMIPVGIYGSTLITMALFASNSTRTTSKAYWICTIGAVLFVLSDSMIALDKFLTPIPFRSLWIMSTYIAAQYLLVYGLTQRIKNQS